MREGMDALMERLGPADAVRFIAGLGGERGRDSVRLVREMRKGLTLEEIVEKVKARRKKGRR
jgi:hypothetical protein